MAHDGYGICSNCWATFRIHNACRVPNSRKCNIGCWDIIQRDVFFIDNSSWLIRPKLCNGETSSSSIHALVILVQTHPFFWSLMFNLSSILVTFGFTIEQLLVYWGNSSGLAWQKSRNHGYLLDWCTSLHLDRLVINSKPDELAH